MDLEKKNKNFIYKFPYEFPNNVRLKIFGNKEILEKPQNWMGIQPSAKSPQQK